MHISSKNNMERCYKKYILGEFLDKRESVKVLDVGSIDINGSFREIFTHNKVKYTGVDLEKGNGVDIVLSNPYKYPISSYSMDIVISGQTFEHCEFFWKSFEEMCRVLDFGGYLFLISPSGGKIHRFPVDCYRFLPDSCNALANWANINQKEYRMVLIESWTDDSSVWKDLVGIFQKNHF